VERGGRNDSRKSERRVSARVGLPAMATNPSHRRGIERPRSEIPRGGDGRSDEATAAADWAGIAGSRPQLKGALRTTPVVASMSGATGASFVLSFRFTRLGARVGTAKRA